METVDGAAFNGCQESRGIIACAKWTVRRGADKKTPCHSRTLSFFRIDNDSISTEKTVSEVERGG